MVRASALRDSVDDGTIASPTNRAPIAKAEKLDD
jgi:hypothetical protein